MSFEQLSVKVENFSQNFSDSSYDKVSKKYPRIIIIKGMLKMHKAIFQNKGQRISNSKNLHEIYQMLGAAFQFWVKYIQESKTEEWIPVVC